AGLYNAAENVAGGMLSAVSVVKERLKGFAVGLFIRVKELRGVIIAPITVVENSKRSKGLQIGLVNVRLDKEKWYNKYRPIFAISKPSKLERIKQKEILAEVELIKESKDLDKLEEKAKYNENSEIRIAALDRLTFLAQRDRHAGIYKLIFFKISEESEYDDAKNRANEMLGEFPYKR
ncbi:hypothetical protein KAW38_02825, partial [Candidatus Micrarchaeota archaeon]|nr:hypothetical protein [Candidatus Micrarchaeota archaeon]